MSWIMIITSKIKSVFNKYISQGYWYNEVQFRDCAKFWKYNSFNTEVINLGSTAGVKAFCYENVPSACANWALSANPLSGYLAILKNYYSYLCEKGATVIIPLCPFTSLAGSYRIDEDRYYTILYPSSIPSYSIRRDNIIRNIKDNPFHSYPVSAIHKDIYMRLIGRKSVRLTEEQMIKDSELWMANWMKEFSIIDFSYPLSMVNIDGIEDALVLLNELIFYCKERGLRPAILIPPVYHTLGQKFTPEIRKILIDSLIDRIEDKSVWFHNYMDDNSFSTDITLFENSFFLNKKGSMLFTNRVLKDLGLL